MTDSKHKRLMIAAAATAALVVGGFAIGRTGITFSHELHVVENESACTECHKTPDASSIPQLDKEFCTDCHDQAGGPLGFKPAPIADRFTTVKFPHGYHVVEEELECSDCHENVGEEEIEAGKRLATPDDVCFVCHDVADMECAACHGVDMKFEQPSYHGEQWPKQHPEVVRNGVPEQHEQNCANCHEGEDLCMTCHQDRKPVSHDKHMNARGAECDQCHSYEGEPGLPTINAEGCTDCHDTIPLSREILARAMPSDINIPHGTHIDAELECLDCHEKTIDESQEPDEPILEQGECLTCHDSNDVNVPTGNCKGCHGVNMRHVEPTYHGPAWPRRHSKEARWEVFERHRFECQNCHTQSKCIACHQTTKPKSHNALWRIRTHGKAASWDRENCRTCHETGVCIRCHQTTRPLNHQPGWRLMHPLVAGDKSNENCAICHQPSWCAKCHNPR